LRVNGRKAGQADVAQVLNNLGISCGVAPVSGLGLSLELPVRALECVGGGNAKNAKPRRRRSLADATNGKTWNRSFLYCVAELHSFCGILLPSESTMEDGKRRKAASEVLTDCHRSEPSRHSVVVLPVRDWNASVAFVMVEDLPVGLCGLRVEGSAMTEEKKL